MTERRSTGPLVLIIEDFDDARELYAEYLRHVGLDVVCAEAADEGLQIARTRHPAAIVMDAALPGMSGWEATRLLKANPETARIPVLMLTGHVFVDAEQRAVDAGVDVFLRKPCLPDMLHDEITAAIARAETMSNGSAGAQRARARERAQDAADSTRLRGGDAPRPERDSA